MSDDRKFDHKKIEPKWQKFWKENKTFRVKNPDNNKDEDDFKREEISRKSVNGQLKTENLKYYILDMFPYPSGAGLHVGHPEGYTATDIIARYKRMKGFHVLHPMGWDAFGLPAENYAIKTGTNPKITTKENIANFMRQIQSLGFSYDWSREFATTDPKYYRFTQWIFLQMYKRGLLYEKKMPMNWCPQCKIVAANEEVEEGKHERCGTEVEKRNLRQWMFRITDYADRLLADLEKPTAVFVHGFDGSPNGIFFPWLTKFAEESGFRVFAPHMPNPKNPQYEEWKAFFEENYAGKVTENSVLFGHSLGGIFLTRFLAETEKKIARLILTAAPETSVGIAEIENFIARDFDPKKIRAGKIDFFAGENDPLVPLAEMRSLAQKLGAEFHLVTNGAHFGGAEYPEFEKPFLEAKKNILDWPKKIIAMQRNWIGKSEGVEVRFKVFQTEKKGERGSLAGGHSKGDSASSASFSAAIVSKNFIEVKRFRPRKKRMLSCISEQIEYQSKKIFFEGKKLFQHFKNKGQKNEFRYRISFAETVIKAIPHFIFESETIAYFASKNQIFRVVLEKNNEKEFTIKTYYLCQKLTKEYQEKQSVLRSITVYTTRPDTLFGVTYIVLSPEHPLVKEITTVEQKTEVEKYKKQCAGKSELERTELNKEKTGAFTGTYAMNPVNDEKIQLWIADYVIMGYGTGAIMAVPAHDERDYEFAKKFGMEIREVVVDFQMNEGFRQKLPFLNSGSCINSNFLNGLPTSEAKEKMIQFLEEKGVGKRQTNYKLRDWIFTRQRYWGEPIPLIHCKTCGIVPHDPEFAKYSQDTKKEEYLSSQSEGGRTYVATANSSFSGRIISSKSPSVNKMQPQNCVKTSIGNIYIDTKRLRKHFEKKKRSERSFRFHHLPIVPEILHNAFFIKKDDKYLAYGRFKQKIFRVIIKRIKNDDYFVSTFYEAGKLSKIWRMLKEKYSLPILLPETDNFLPTDDGESPLAKIENWVNIPCPKCGELAKRETSTMPNWAGSNWYWLRFMDPKNENEPWSKQAEHYWGPVDLYVGGAEHAVLHLLYSRFWHKVFYDMGLVSTKEPFTKLMNQGLILAEDGVKMSKSLGNVVNPDEIVEKYGADTLRMYEMFMGPFEQNVSWSTAAVDGMNKFLQKIWRLFVEKKLTENKKSDSFTRLSHKTVKKVSGDIEEFKFNTAISQMMIFVNAAQKESTLPKAEMEKFVQLLSPFAPHLAEEIWHEILGNTSSISFSLWPEWNEELTKDDEIQLAVQVNGKLRAMLSVVADIEKDEAIILAKENENVQKFLEGNQIVKEIFVPGKIVNLVVK